MAATTSPVVRVLEQLRVSPPPGSVAADTSIPLSLFDAIWVYLSPVERLFFYELPQPTTYFIHTLLPNLKRHLSLTLQHFYPLAGILRPKPDDSTRHEIHCTPGDFVSLTLAECDVDFGELVGNQPRDVNLFLPLVPKLQRAGSTVAVMALQVTLFPNSGFCIGVSTHHTVCNGSGSTQFLKSWASACRSEGADSPIIPPPIHDRTMISDPDGLYTTLCNGILILKASRQDGVPLASSTPASTVISTFVLGREHIQRLKDRFLSRRRESDAQIKISTFVLTCACIWVSLTRARAESSSSNNNMEPSSYFGFAMDARARLKRKIPKEYFGNCLAVCFVKAPRSALMEEDGVFVASEAIAREIKAMDGDVLRGAGEWPSKLAYWMSKGSSSVAGSPRFGVYEVDFGWGRPVKVEVISIGGTGAMSLAESREDEGGVEIGFARTVPEMEQFKHQFAKLLKNLMDGDLR